MKRWKDWRMIAHPPTFLSLHLHYNSFSNPSVALPMSQLILEPFCCFTYITVHPPTLPLLYLHHSSFSNPSVASLTSQFIFQPFFCFSYVTSSSLNSPGKPPMVFCISLLVILYRSKFFFVLPHSFGLCAYNFDAVSN